MDIHERIRRDVYKDVRRAAKKLTDAELLALNNATQKGLDPRPIIGFQKIGGLERRLYSCFQKNIPTAGFITKEAMADLTIERLSREGNSKK